MRVQPGTVLVCREPSCGAVLQVTAPSAIGRSYRCACGQLLLFEGEDAEAGPVAAAPGRD